MKKLSTYQRLFETDSELIERLLEEWKPSSLEAEETDLEKELFTWLKSQLPDVPMLTQYGIAKGKADIVIQDQHVLELKLSFGANGVGEFDRCLGQLWRYKEKWIRQKEDAYVWLIIVGDSEPEFRSLLQKWCSEANEDFFFKRFRLFEKTSKISEPSFLSFLNF